MHRVTNASREEGELSGDVEHGNLRFSHAQIQENKHYQSRNLSVAILRQINENETTWDSTDDELSK